MKRKAVRIIVFIAVVIAFAGCQLLVSDLSNEDITVDHDVLEDDMAMEGDAVRPDTHDDTHDNPDAVVDAADLVDAPDLVEDSADVIADDIGEEEFECLLPEHCTDGDICNGDETCDPDSHTCVEGLARDDGFLCGAGPRKICLEEECLASICGDGFIDEGGGEFCEPPDVGGCDGECKLGCDGPEDCPDDEVFCNGEEYCNLDTHACDRRNVPEDGDECGTGLVCCSGDCVECCDTTQCADGNECTNDVCSEGACSNPNKAEGTLCDDGAGYCCVGECLECCVHEHCDDADECTADVCTGEGTCRNPKKDDMVECTGGVCCNGTCRVGGDCCAHTDCTDGCRGTAAACGTFDSGTCTSQTGCSWDPAGPCDGVGVLCLTLTEDQCNACGASICTWTDGPPAACVGERVACTLLETSAQCLTTCGCTWDGAGPCIGTHRACSTYGSQAACNNQGGCHWSVCTSYGCT